ncbi:arrestin domain-containing protein 3-like [Cyclopterus lumpus]|uniref:arrestin domain-containing protein 3-like n=1 Tax=Cyclopterus lumpus TaxID=8103 RepID=UPI0014869D28|nr:arrestin domain-containing protein 3-like [Cyclopterus lumpus]
MFQQTIKDFNLNFNALNEKNSVSEGDLMTGHISFVLTKPTKITSVAMALAGTANVHWSTGGGGGRRRRRRRHYSAKLDFFNFQSVIVQDNSAVGAQLQPGRHVYPFTCQLPHGHFPSTFRGVHGQIVYTLTVSIHRRWHMAKNFVTELNFVNRINTNQPELQAPLSGSNNMTLCCLCCASGLVTMTASVVKKAFVPGETVNIVCEFSNASSQTATPKVVLQQKQVCYTTNKVNKKMVIKNLASVTGRSVRAHTSDVHAGITLAIPAAAPLTISNCSIIDVDYIIEVSLSMRASPDLTVLFPIILCDTPVSAQPLRYS